MLLPFQKRSTQAWNMKKKKKAKFASRNSFSFCWELMTSLPKLGSFLIKLSCSTVDSGLTTRHEKAKVSMIQSCCVITTLFRPFNKTIWPANYPPLHPRVGSNRHRIQPIYMFYLQALFALLQIVKKTQIFFLIYDEAHLTNHARNIIRG